MTTVHGPSDDEKNKARAQTELQLGVSASNATALKKKANHPENDEGRTMGPIPSRLPIRAKKPNLKDRQKSPQRSGDMSRRILPVNTRAPVERGIGYFNGAWRNFI